MTTETDQDTTQSLLLSRAEFDTLLRRLNLANTRRTYQAFARRAEQESWSYCDFLGRLLMEEVAKRKQTRLQRCTRSAHFPFFKTIEEFDFAQPSKLRKSLLGSYLGPDFVTEGRSLILHGKTGRGKTHLAVAIGYRAIQNGFETLFATAAELIEDLSNASQKGHLHQSLATYTHPHVLIVDEVGYLAYGPDAANVLFHVVNVRHLKKRPMIFTTNKPLNQWGKVLHDEDLAAAILDRILERGRLLQLDGPSGRTRHLQIQENLPSGSESARISGTHIWGRNMIESHNQEAQLTPPNVVSDAKSDLKTPSEAAEYLVTTVGTLAVWRSTRRYNLRFTRIGRKIFYRLRDLEKFIESRADAGIDEPHRSRASRSIRRKASGIALRHYDEAKKNEVLRTRQSGRLREAPGV